ncbi:DNA repair protein RAD51 homolog 4 isoform X1 [Pristis pectinata]|uniref:DNA repair protein RAD51 homolog 4 isoform X1 n=1 Tax=Pristis pectinata TaxID=685728 RepID=UPI00223CE444|nr:DNA repair protein RAD51 homolog 4 isoform X1 [Pristis pectinata]XP_051891218.1 DNA repair protein RAD51 homolog 4 isoform X1 [Pristis pectinata]
MVILREGICPGATAQLIQALKEQNVKTVVNLVSADIEDLAQKCSISYKTLVAVRRVLLAQYSPFPSNGADLYEELLGSTAILSTGSQSLDKLLDSGLYTGELTEFVGAPGSGKTQVCLSLAVNIACELKQKVLYIDSRGGLSSSRLLQLIQSQVDSMEEQSEALQRIEVVRVFEVHCLLDVLQDLRASSARQATGAHSSVKAVVVDSATAVLSPVLGGHQVEGISLMMQLARELKTLARELGIAVIVTNSVVRDTGGDVKPALGCSWSYVPNVRILLQREPDTAGPAKRSATILKSSRQPTRISVEFDITSCGTLGSRTAPSQPSTGDRGNT